MRESKLETDAIKYADQRGWLYRKLRWIGRRGAPDRLFIREGLVVFVEFKQSGKEPTVQQAREQKRLRDAGVTVWVIDSIDAAKNLFR